MVQLSEKTKTRLEENLGMGLAHFLDMDADSQTAYIEKKTGRPVVFSKRYDQRKIGRGSPLLARRKIKSIQEVNEKIDKLR